MSVGEQTPTKLRRHQVIPTPTSKRRLPNAGRDQSIAIIGASSDPSLAADLHVFDQAFGLPDPALNISYVHCDITQWTCQPGSPGSPNPANSVETSIDVEWSHALAPQATVNLILVDSSDATTAEQVLEYIVSTAGYAIDKHLGEVVSLSVGFAEQCSPPAFLAFEHGIFEKAKEKAITVAASAGDTGSTQYTCDVKSFFTSPVVATPASDPLVLAVGGSHLVAGSDGTYQSETAWTQVSVKHNNGAGGGGFSSIFSLPGYQRGITTGSMRGIPDVSVDADPNSGYIVECSFCNNNHRVFFRIGGTSVSAPVWAGIIALADQMAGHSLGFVNPALYAIAQASSRGQAFHDIVGGNNSYSFINSGGLVETVPGYKAVAGWDAATGLGSPNAVGLLPLLVTMTP